jgi:hypothetical protein
LVEFIRSRFAAKHPQSKIKRVIIKTSNWARLTSWKWSSNLSWYKEDVSTVDAIVFTAGDNPEHVYMWPTPLVRDHMQGGKQVVYLPNTLGKPDITMILLAGKLK